MGPQAGDRDSRSMCRSRTQQEMTSPGTLGVPGFIGQCANAVLVVWTLKASKTLIIGVNRCGRSVAHGSVGKKKM